jgi:ribosomal protein S18 acetylase RimI-like enzyme
MKIRNITAKDRVIIYDILQHHESLSPPEIEAAMVHMDAYLFGNEQHRYRAVLAENDLHEIAGYACYAADRFTKDIFYIHTLVASPPFYHHPLPELLLQHIEADIQRHNGSMVIVTLSSENRHDELRNFYLGQQYQAAPGIKDFYGNGIDRLFLVHYLKQTT